MILAVKHFMVKSESLSEAPHKDSTIDLRLDQDKCLVLGLLSLALEGWGCVYLAWFGFRDSLAIQPRPASTHDPPTSASQVLGLCMCHHTWLECGLVYQ
jgi:hypothetical protein